ncbi:unnamed protein product [Prorocentrum cordatum]|uniref:Uncharacterized protein n=1 Tax=Prorocentrum cordatum TaxID=2364126 RepID=A0ABN9S0R1_9DINO|nr:unnamed protein product [Polarella glacialis]
MRQLQDRAALMQFADAEIGWLPDMFTDMLASNRVRKTCAGYDGSGRSKLQNNYNFEPDGVVGHPTYTLDSGDPVVPTRRPPRIASLLQCTGKPSGKRLFDQVAARRKVDEEGGPELLLESLAAALAEPGAALADLDLAQNGSLAPEHFETLFDTIVTTDVPVAKLRLFGCPRFNDEAAAHLAQLLALATPETAPAELHLSDCAITTAGFLALMRAVEEGDVYPLVRGPTETQPLFLRCERNFIDEAVIEEKIGAGVIRATSGTQSRRESDPAVRVHLFTVGGKSAQLAGEPADLAAQAAAAAAARQGRKRGSDAMGAERGEDAAPTSKRSKKRRGRKAQPQAAPSQAARTAAPQMLPPPRMEQPASAGGARPRGGIRRPSRGGPRRPSATLARLPFGGLRRPPATLGSHRAAAFEGTRRPSLGGPRRSQPVFHGVLRCGSADGRVQGPPDGHMPSAR